MFRSILNRGEGKFCVHFYSNICSRMNLTSMQLAALKRSLFHPHGRGEGKQMVGSRRAGSQRSVFTHKHNITSSSGFIVLGVCVCVC